MKMVKSLLLGSAAALAAVTVAQAADLPVKAKPVQYVKICDLYGAGFYYMPGTDICLKLGGFVRQQIYYHSGNQPGFGLPFGQANGQNVDVATNAGQPSDLVFRTRAVITVDTRQATDYGTLRTYWLMGFTHENGSAINGASGGNAPGLYATRGFIQWAGFTMGKAVSFFDIYSIGAFGYTVLPGSDTGDGGQNLLAYTWQLGNGVTATLSLEDPRRIAMVETNLAGAFPVGGFSANNAHSVRIPDVVGSIRIDQAWGSLQLAGAVTDASSGLYTTKQGVGAIASSLTGNAVFGRPDDELGFAIGFGGMIRADAISPGDLFGFQINYAEGASKYINNTMPNAGTLGQFSGGNLTLGQITDGVFGTFANGVRSDVELTEAFGFNVGYNHVWNPNWQTSLYGGYNQFEHSGNATTLICNNLAAAGKGAGTVQIGAATGGVCDPDFSYWFVGSRTAWTPSRGWELGVDIIYYNLDTAHSGTGLFTAATGGARPTGLYTLDDNDNLFTISFRAQRSFLP